MGGIEEARRLLQARLDAGRTPTERNRFGQFSTPSLLSEQAVLAGLAALGRDVPIRYLEPGFGTGPFYSALLSHVGTERLKHACGYEIDPHYGRAAQSFWEASGLQLKLENFTAATPPDSNRDKFNLIICNPPYVRHHHLDRQQKAFLAEQVRLQTGRRLNGLAGLYCYFLLLSRAWMTPGGVGVWLIPSEFLDVNYGREVLRFLVEDVTLLRIHRFDPSDVQFADALVSSAVVVLRNASPAPNHRVRITFGGSLDRPQTTALVTSDQLQRTSKGTQPARRRASLGRTPGRTLSDVFVIRRGIATGCNAYFIVSPQRANELGIPKRFLTPILPGPRALPHDEIEADDDGHPVLEHARFLIDCDLSETELRRAAPALQAYYQTGKESGIDRRYLCVHRNPWYSQERRAAPPFLCTYMGRSSRPGSAPFRFLLNQSQAVATNVYLLLYPKPGDFTERLSSPDARRSVWTWLNAIAAKTLTSEGRTYGGGLHKLEPRELGNVPAEGLLELLAVGRSV